MWIATVQKTVTDEVTGDEILYTFSVSASTEDLATSLACVYASMVEYGMEARQWAPGDMLFPREELYQFIQPNSLAVIEDMYPDAVPTAYRNAVAYVNSYIGNMFDVETMIADEDTTATGLTLRLILCLQTAIFILASSPQYSDVIECHKHQLNVLLKGLKAGSRNFGVNSAIAEPNARLQVVNLTKVTNRP